MSDMPPVVLVIDDEPQIRRFLRAGFDLEHFTVLEEETGEADCAPPRCASPT